ncbi:MAG: hypothetical protein ACI9WU_002831, partial [Myxococcota bacterium]
MRVTAAVLLSLVSMSCATAETEVAEIEDLGTLAGKADAEIRRTLTLEPGAIKRF